MNAIDDTQIGAMAKACVEGMGDIFWDYNAERDSAGGYKDPSEVAATSVEKTLRELAAAMDRDTVYPRVLREEYRTLVAELGDLPDDQQVAAALIAEADWTDRGATEVLRLARMYGTSILRNALALAEALDVEDGEAGF